MSHQVTTHQVKMFSANVYHLAQQSGSRLFKYVRQEQQKGKVDFFDSYGSVEMREKTSRHSDIEYSDTPHSRRKVTTKYYYHADLVDNDDKLKMLHDPTSQYAIAAKKAAGRKMDQTIIAGALNSAWIGEEGTTETILPTTQKLCAHDGTTTSAVKMNLTTLKAIKAKFWGNEAIEDDENEEIILVLDSNNLIGLLDDEEIVNGDYNTVKALVKGDIDTFMGFRFVRTQLVPVTATTTAFNPATGALEASTGTAAIGSRRCVAFLKNAVLYSSFGGIGAKVTELPAKHYSKQVYTHLECGSTRMEEVGVVEVICKA